MSAAAQTIVALATGQGKAGVAIVRCSGAQARAALQAVTGRTSLPEPRMLARASLRTGTGALIDRGLVSWFPGPRSFTGEDVAEFHVHGGPAVVRGLLDSMVWSCSS